MATYKYFVLIEKGETNYGGYAPDLPGLGVTGATKEEVIQRMKEAMKFHLEGLKSGGDPIPDVSIVQTECMSVEVD